MQHHFATVRAQAVLPEIDALPGAERQAPIGKRDRQLHGRQRSPHVRWHVVGAFIAMPEQRIAVRNQTREEPIEVA